MGRKKKSVDVVENPTPMQEDAMNEPVEAVAEEKTEESIGEVVQPEPEVEQKKEVVSEPSLVTSEPKKMRIHSNTNLVNVREKPDGEVLFRLQNGSPIMVEEEKDGWCKITGYVMKDLVGIL